MFEPRPVNGDPPPGIAYAGIGDESGAALSDQLEATRRLGWTGIELRNVDGIALADLDDEATVRLAETLRSAGLTPVCLDSRIANWSRPITGGFEQDLAELDVLIGLCATLGTRYVRVMSYPNDGLGDAEWGRRVLDRMRVLAERAERGGVVLLHENCSGWAGSSAERMLTMLDQVASPALRLLFDIGNGIEYGYEAYEVLTQVVGHVAHVHVKDAIGDAADPVYCLPGEGRAGVADCLRLLLINGFTGTWSIEPHISVRPHEALDDAGADGIAAFVAYGRRLERLVQDEVLPGATAIARIGPGTGGSLRS
jgi:sugar phosphate isomerase/epimerase